MEYKNMRMLELKSLAREHRLRGYSQMRKADLVALLQNSPPPSQSRASTSLTPPSQAWEPMDDRRPRKPSPQEMDIFEQQEMSKSRPQVKGKLNKWYNLLINHVPKSIKDGASRAFKTFKDKVMGLYDRVSGSTQWRAGPSTAKRGAASTEPKLFKPTELEEAF